MNAPCLTDEQSPPSRGRGSKPWRSRSTAAARSGRPPRGGVDRNSVDGLDARLMESRPPRGGVDRNDPDALHDGLHICRPPRGGVDRNILGVIGNPRTARSPPSRGRGSKPPTEAQSRQDRRVAPLAGAWIETRMTVPFGSPMLSPPSRGRGSKLSEMGTERSRPWSPPSRGRGSKRSRIFRCTGCRRRSPPSRGRGSKRIPARYPSSAPTVAPLAGAWIETITALWAISRDDGRPPRGGVDRNLLEGT